MALTVASPKLSLAEATLGRWVGLPINMGGELGYVACAGRVTAVNDDKSIVVTLLGSTWPRTELRGTIISITQERFGRGEATIYAMTNDEEAEHTEEAQKWIEEQRGFLERLMEALES